MISNKCNYALKALLELASPDSRGPKAIPEIARRRDIPSRFLEAILRQLKQAGITDSVRGKEGGYLLARPAEEITLAEVLRLIEGPIIAAGEDGAESGDIFGVIWQDAEKELNRRFTDISFKDLVDMERERVTSSVRNYTI